MPAGDEQRQLASATSGGEKSWSLVGPPASVPGGRADIFVCQAHSLLRDHVGHPLGAACFLKADKTHPTLADRVGQGAAIRNGRRRHHRTPLV